ncbi:DinB family protein [Actinocorallia longicatena]|uniref:DinB family protein n=1 Tax=Actinocorallia longicatena TaxID=111803 RepID=A0ABP6QKR1_9ACTN
MSITPDDKNWTWVVERACPECGFDASAIDVGDVAGLLAANSAEWHALLRSPGAHDVRPVPSKWSALEYGCHVRDCIRIYDYRLRRMLEEDGPSYPGWDQDATAVEERYGEQDPVTVADELLEASRSLEARFAGVTGEQWRRTGHRSDGASFTVETFARYFIHDPIHHWHDVRG